MTLKERFKLWLPAMIWMVIIFFISGQPINNPGVAFSWLDFIFKKTGHLTEYAILYGLIFRAVSQKGKFTYKKIFMTAFVLGLIYALTDEWHQTFVTGREGTLRDVGFDSLGMLAGLIITRNWL
ncbi:MAG: VanZ family protein [Candidatus Beckwithbacteria bacterium]|nr:VanZ family protein [Candidatus Beckwithbacteria bacterium]